MKYCLSSRVGRNYLAAADQVKIDYNDRKFLLNLLLDDNSPLENKTIVIEHQPGGNSIEYNSKAWEELKILSKNNLVLCLSSFDDIELAKTYDIPFYMGYPVRTFEQLKTFVDLGVSQVVVDGNIFFDLKTVRSLYPTLQIRVSPNVAHIDGYPRKDGVIGTWIRPETIDKYEGLIDIIEFADCEGKINKEQALYRIYKEGIWNGDLSQIITNLNIPADNPLIKYDEARIDCRQKCAAGGSCRICYRTLGLAASKNKIKEFKEKLEKS